ncbi:MAG: Lrp/AsnC ligand binding domain-containing protein, partial [Candidatus Bathyarchaeota archaeon]|nr:Lrp/AsnC ligand binding domain-containing protein [Candidatus Bathyarchaeota archaeon]
NVAETTPNKGHIPKARIIEEIKKYNEVNELADVQGAHFDLVVKGRFRSLKELSAFIEKWRAIEGIEELFAAIIAEKIV